jgi:hypothetical protein
MKLVCSKNELALMLRNRNRETFRIVDERLPDFVTYRRIRPPVLVLTEFTEAKMRFPLTPRGLEIVINGATCMKSNDREPCKTFKIVVFRSTKDTLIRRPSASTRALNILTVMN